MAITLVSGKPGSGKTLYVVKQIADKFRKEVDSAGNPRPIFHNITELNFSEPHIQQIEHPHLWFDLPENSIIILDECQHQFPVRNGSKGVPACVSEMNTHRHKGFDLILITQHPRLLDRAIFPLVELHFHMHRSFALGRSTLYRWEGVNENPEPLQSRANSQKSNFMFGKKYFAFYKSSSEHNMKMRLPWKIILLLVGALIVLVFAGVYVSRFLGRHNADTGAIAQIGGDGAEKAGGAAGGVPDALACAVLVGYSGARSIVKVRGSVLRLPAAYQVVDGVIFDAQGLPFILVCSQPDNAARPSEAR